MEFGTTLATAGTKAAEGFLTTLFGPAGTELGLLLRDKIAARRYKSLIRISTNAQALLGVLDRVFEQLQNEQIVRIKIEPCRWTPLQ